MKVICKYPNSPGLGMGVQNILREYIILYGDAKYPRIFCTGMLKMVGVEFPMTPA